MAVKGDESSFPNDARDVIVQQEEETPPHVKAFNLYITKRYRYV